MLHDLALRSRAPFAQVPEVVVGDGRVVKCQRRDVHEFKRPLPAKHRLGRILQPVRLGNAPFDEAGLQNLHALDSLRSLYFDGAQFTDAGVVHLAGLNLEELGLHNTNISDDGLRRLQTLPDLRKLFLSGASVTDAGLDHLTGLTHLEVLALDNTQISDDGLRRLERLSNLRRVYLAGTNVTDAGVGELQSRMPGLVVER